MISKELLSEVLGYGVMSHEKAIWSNSILVVTSNAFYTENINIHKLAHKCKEWARVHYNLYTIPTFQCQLDGSIDMIVTDNEDFINNRNERYSVSAKTEPEAIFKACEWILTQKANQ